MLDNCDCYHHRDRPLLTEVLTSIDTAVVRNRIATPLGDGSSIVGLANF